MSTDERKKILEDIEKTGYPLEIDVINRFMEAGWSVIPQYIYRDEHTGKLKSVDIVSFFGKEYKDEIPKIVLECKTSEKPWIFYSSPTISEEIKKISQENFDVKKWSEQGINLLYQNPTASILSSIFSKDIDWSEKIDSKQAVEIFNLSLKIHYNRVLSRAHSCHVAFRKHTKEDSPDDFHRAINQIIGTCSQIAEASPGTPLVQAIVLRGKMFEYIRTKRGAKLEPQNHILFSTLWFKPRKTKKFFPAEYSSLPIIVDVVRDTHFAEYLKLLKEDMDAISNLTEIINQVIKNE